MRHMKVAYSCRRLWMLAGFAAAFLVGDMFLAVRGAATTSVEDEGSELIDTGTPSEARQN